MDTVYFASNRKKVTLGDYIVGLYILAIFVFENAKFSKLFSIIQLLFFVYLAWMVFNYKVLPFNIYTKWILIIFLFMIVFCFAGTNKNVNASSIIVFKNLLKGFCITFYLYIKKNDKFLIKSIAFAGLVCGCFIITSFLSNPISNFELKYASNSRVGVEIAGDNVNVVAMNMCFAFASCMCLAKDASKKNIKIFWYLSLAFIVFSSFFTGTRKAIAVFVIIFVLANNDMKLKYKLLGLLIFFVMYWALMNIDVLYFLLGHKFDFFGNNAYKMYDYSDQIRRELLINSWNIFKANPWGSGFGAVQSMLGVYSHNNYIEVLTSLGFFGFAFYYAIYIWFLCKSFFLRKDIFCQFCFYTLVGIMVLEFGQITCYYPMIYVFVPLIEYIICYKEKTGIFFYESKNC